MRKLALTLMLGAFALGFAGCADGAGKPSSTRLGAVQTTRSDSHTTVHVIAGSRQTIDGVNLRNSARFLSPRRLAILTWGSTTCPAVPNSLVVETPNRIRIHLATGSWHRRLPVTRLPLEGACTADHSSAVIVIAINPKRIDVHHRLTISLYYYKSKKPESRTAPPL
jgi:hypothetical protein